MTNSSKPHRTWTWFHPVLAIMMIWHTSEANIGYFWQITDLHLELNYSVSVANRDKMCWRQNGGFRSPEGHGRYGSHSCDSPFILVESAIKAMKNITGHEGIEFILWTGDSVSHSTYHDESIKDDTVFSVLKNITYLLKTQFPFSNIYPVLGNMDWYAKSRMTSSAGYAEFHNRLKLYGQLWSNWVPPESLFDFEKGGYYAIQARDRRTLLLILNTSLYEKRQWIGANEEDPAGQFAWLHEKLKMAMAMGNMVFIIGHIPPGKMERYMSSRFGHHAYQDQFNKRYLRLVRDYHSIIAGQFFGHFHSDSFRVFYEKMDKTKGKFLERNPISYLFLAPAVSPRKSTLGDEIGPNNPGLRLYQYNTSSGQIYDYTQYYLNLTEANEMNRAEWKILYNFTNYYRLQNVSAASLSDLAFSFLKDSGSENFNKYYFANSVGYEDPSKCLNLCRRTHFCVITNVDYQDYERCIQTVFGSIGSANFLIVNINTTLFFLLFVLVINLVGSSGQLY
ncbi:acid sphingomyelinase-like phosphodiesterase 3b [Folsomia candida]|uniref:acid sphingomyelinase-like phosphodiesterase 3b n=1 Tax=Folsomia candida TaxID=158441 RepID=UPI001604D60E|nr:acid sphingomyelinase-like phosphodiesterase 3b [Folsomia candida]XP_035708862.1 acid sphingomyelinase-like phosphodiesterase 3b [Folsomia candida]